MSGREREHEIDQVGNLVPRDVVEVLALERHSSKSKRRRRTGGTFRRAFGWLRRGKKGKNARAPLQDHDLMSLDTLVPVPKPSANAGKRRQFTLQPKRVVNSF